MEKDSYRITPRSIVSHRILRGFSGTVSVQYLTSWNELEKTSRETEQDLEQYGNVVERYWAGEPKQVGGKNAKYRAYRVQMAKRSQAQSTGKVYVPPGHKLKCGPRCGPDMCSPDSIGSYIFLKTAGNGWQLRRCSTEGSALTRTFDAINSRHLTSAVTRERGRCWKKRIYVNGGEHSGSRVPLVVREGAVCLVDPFND